LVKIYPKIATMEVPYLRTAIAIALVEARHAAGLTQPQLADFAGLSRSYVAALEAGKTSFSIESLYALLFVVQIDSPNFFTRVEELRSQSPALSMPGKGRRRMKNLSGIESPAAPGHFASRGRNTFE
jgi:transcriptional regulator with XRE-family HTH domain